MIDKPLDEIVAADLQRLVDNAVPEGRRLEYKEQLPGGTHEDKKEFLADVSSFANSTGGDLFFGIVEQRDGNKPTGVPASLRGVGGTIDILRLESVLQDGLAPRVQGIKFRVIPGVPDGAALVVRVPNSWNRPHMVTYQHWSRFYARNSQGKYLLDVTELRQAFVAGASAAQQARLFIRDRIAGIDAGEIDVVLDSGPSFAVHVVPLSAFDRTEQVNLQKAHAEHSLIAPLYATGFARRFNLDGFCTYSTSGDQNHHYAYLQLFRNGAIEGVSTGAFIPKEQAGYSIASRTMAESIVDFIARALKLMLLLDIEPPALVGLSLLGVRGVILGVSQSLSIDNPVRSFTRDVVILPEVLIEDVNKPATEIARPILDALWQAAGFDRSYEYDDDGNWRAAR